MFVICGCESQQTNASSNDLSSSQYTYEIANNSVKILTHKDTGALNIVIPETIENNPVTTLGKDAFYNHKNTVSITLPQNLNTIEGSPFYRCYSLKNIVITKNVKYISCNPFFRSSSLENITVDKENLYFSDIDGVLFNKEQTLLISYPEGKQEINYTVPETVEQLAVDSFGYHPNIKNLTIKANVKKMPDGNMFVYPDDITLHVEKNSAAEKYAIKFDIKYIILES